MKTGRLIPNDFSESAGKWRTPRAARDMVFNYKKNRPWAENLSIVMQLGLTMAGCIVFCFFVGYWIDGWLGTRGVFITIFTLLGVVGGANVAYRQIMETFQEPKNDGPEEDHRPDDGND